MPGRIFRARFHSEENDSYVELWKLVGRTGYIARHTYGPKRWYYVSDLLGYRELDHPIGDDATAIVCGRDGRELFRTSNADGSVDFNTPKQEAYARWAEYAVGRRHRRPFRAVLRPLGDGDARRRFQPMASKLPRPGALSESEGLRGELVLVP